VKGKCKWFSPEKGFGFITMENGKDIFVHHSAIQQEGYRTLDADDAVEFEIGESEKGPQAEKVIKI